MRYVYLMSLFNLLIISYTVQADYVMWGGVAFSADRTITNPAAGPSVEKSKVYYSKAGTRVEVGEGTSRIISIVNYKKQKCWLINERHKIYREVDLDVKTAQCSMPINSGFNAELRDPSVFLPKPCYSYSTMKPMGKDYVAGRRVSQWQCVNNETGATTRQWYDPTLRMVIREVTDSGRVTEATNIKLSRKPDLSLLLPPTGYRKQPRMY